MSSQSSPQPPPPGVNVHWLNVLFYIYLHLTAAYGLGLVFTEAALSTTLFALLLIAVIPFSTTLVHRHFVHNAFKVSTPFKVLIVALHTCVGQGSVYDWVQEHRFHHAVRGTALDPYDPRRGFWFAHLNNKMVKRRPDQEAAKAAVDMSDLEADAVVMWQKRLYFVAMPVLAFLLPVNAPTEYWGESLLTSLSVVGAIRQVVVLHAAWLVTSGPLLFGLVHAQRETDSNQVFFIRRSRWPDYHYTLPWDYKTSEYGSYGDDWTTWVIDAAASLGWASELRTCSSETMKKALLVTLDEKLPIKDSVLKVLESEKATLEETTGK